MESYKDLHASQIDRGKFISSETPGDQINEWLKLSRNCLIHVEDRVPTLLRDFDGLNFYFGMSEEDIVTEVVEKGGRC
jgi:hypothetical protein